MYEDLFIPTFIINLPHRQDRMNHIKSEFSGRPEFNITIMQAIQDEIGAMGLWKSIVNIVEIANRLNHDVILICEDDHQFTDYYSKEHLFDNIIAANEQGADILLGGIAGFGDAAYIAPSRYLINWFYSTQFVIVYSRLFQKILTSEFENTDVADLKLSYLAECKMVLYPFISVQKDFGYSDVTITNEIEKGRVSRLFKESAERFETLSKF